MFYSKLRVLVCILFVALLVSCGDSKGPKVSKSTPTPKATKAVEQPLADLPPDYSDSPFATRPDDPPPKEVAVVPVTGDSPFSSGSDSDSVFAERSDEVGYESSMSRRPERAEEEVEFAPQPSDTDTDEPRPSAFATDLPDPPVLPKPKPVEREPAPAPVRTPEAAPTPKEVAARAVVERPPAPRPKPRKTRKVPRRYDNDIAKLAFELTEEHTTEKEKVHALYTWLCENIAYDTKAYFSGDYGDNTAETVLRRKSGVCAGYANLFEAMTDELGIESEIVVGHSKGYGFEPGKEGGDLHAWNVVKVDGRWALLDATWGSGYINTDKAFVRRVTDDWFMTPPKAFIYTHLPEDDKWQLTDETINEQQYGELPQVNPSFFRYGLRLGGTDKGTVKAGEALTIKLFSDTGAEIHANLAEGKTRLPLEAAMVSQKGESVTIKTRFQKKGDYELLIFASLPGDEKSSHVMSYRVLAEGGAASLFPYAYRDYDERDCELLAGFDQNLKAGRRNTIKVRVPGAEKVSAKNGDKRIPFEKHGDVFTVALSPDPGEVKILTHYPGRRKLPVILKYQAL